jgi:glycosyltransferase involved in cell wall biosynthesis
VNAKGCDRIRVLHCLGGLNRGGVETWLLRVLRNIDRRRFQMDFLVHTTEKRGYDDEVRALGSQIIPCPLGMRSRPWQYARNFKRVYDQFGLYDVIHSHNYLFAGVDLFLARRCRIPTRIAHIYPTEDWKAHSGSTLIRTAYRKAMAFSICRNARYVLFDSEGAKDAFARLAGHGSPKFRVQHPSIELAQFEKSIAIESARAELNIPMDAKVVISVARYAPHKNHRHLVEIARRIVSARGNVVFLSVGDGPLYPEIRALVRDVGLEDMFRFVTSRPELVSLYKASDVLLFPSLMEGFGLVVVEAAAAGLPVVASRIPGIMDAAQACPAALLVEPGDTEGFVQGVLGCLDQPKEKYSPNPALLKPFDISTSVENLMRLYAG